MYSTPSLSGSSENAPLYQSWHLLARGLHNHGMRAMVAAQNFVNAESVGRTPDEEPYTRQMIEIEAHRDRKTDMFMPRIRSISDDPSPPRMVHMPGHPAANEKGLVKMPHINKHLEASDYQQANIASMGCAKLYEITSMMLERTHNLMRRA